MVLAALLACAPANRVDGFVGDQQLSIASAHLTWLPGALGDDDLLVATLSSLPDSCGLERAFEQLAGQSDQPDQLAAAWAATYPPAFWQVDVVARVPGASWPSKGELWVGLPWDAFPEEPNTLFASFTEHRALRDEAWWGGEAIEEDDYETVWFSDEGTALWRAGTPSQHARGRFNTFVADGEGVRDGLVEVFFDVSVCPP
ncbi:MAG: hypothetical protein KC621_27395 [Myxococcales bacterium]|nr:hypothetical protein [Myxococcales bacterium]